MATTFIDVGLITGAQFIFAFLIVWIITYVLLGFADTFKSQQPLRAILALAVGLLTLAVPKVLSVVSLIVPWFAIIFVFIMFLLLGLMIFGIPMDTIKGMVLEKENPVINFVIIIFIIIFVAGMGFVFFSGTPDTQETQTIISADGTVTTGNVGGTGPGALLATLFHPKVLGGIFVLLLGLFTVLLLVK